MNTLERLNNLSKNNTYYLEAFPIDNRNWHVIYEDIKSMSSQDMLNNVLILEAAQSSLSTGITDKLDKIDSIKLKLRNSLGLTDNEIDILIG